MAGINDHWVRQVRHGTKVLFWALPISVVLSTFGSIGLAVLGGTRSDLRWVALVPAFAGLLLLVGVYGVTAPVPCPEDIKVPDTPRGAVRACAVLAVLGEFARLLARHVRAWPPMPYVWAGERLVVSAAIFLLFLYFRTLAVRFHQARLSQSLWLMAWLGALANLLTIFNLEGMYENLGLSLSTYQILSWSRMSLRFVVWIWAFRLLWTLANRIVIAAQERCINCGYSHVGLTDPRCPECGLAFDMGSANTAT